VQLMRCLALPRLRPVGVTAQRLAGLVERLLRSGGIGLLQAQARKIP